MAQGEIGPAPAKPENPAAPIRAAHRRITLGKDPGQTVRRRYDRPLRGWSDAYQNANPITAAQPAA